MEYLRATRLKITTEEALKAVRRCSKHVEHPALQFAEAGKPLFRRLAAAQSARKANAGFDRR